MDMIIDYINRHQGEFDCFWFYRAGGRGCYFLL